MNMKPEELTENGYVLLDKLEHNELVPFIRMYMKKWTKYTVFYYLCNLILFGVVVYLLVQGYNLPNYSFGDRFTHLSYGFALAFALIPLHEYIHVLAYKSQGATTTSYDVNLKKFCFMALADKFVANKKEFEIVAIAPFITISTTLLLVLFNVNASWQLMLSGGLLAHSAMCSGDFGLLSYMEFHKDKQPVTFDDVAHKISYFYGKTSERN